jgi:hypothetical protein
MHLGCAIVAIPMLGTQSIFVLIMLGKVIFPQTQFWYKFNNHSGKGKAKLSVTSPGS